MKPITAVLKTGQWKGHHAFVVGSGPSLKTFDREKLRNELTTIGCNMEYKWGPAIAIVQDPRLFEGDGDMRGLKDEPTWYNGPSIPVYFKGHPDRAEVSAPDSILEARSCHSRETPFLWGDTLEGGLTYGANVGLAALSLACALGASPIYLLGFDCGFGPRRETHCHSHYPDNWRLSDSNLADVYKRWVAEFARHAPSIKNEVRVVGPSALTCFKKMSFSEFDEVLE